MLSSGPHIRGIQRYLTALVVLAMASGQTVFAQTSPDTMPMCRIAAETIVIDGKVSRSVQLTVQKKSSAVIEVPGGIRNAVAPKDKRFHYVFSPDDTKLYIIARASAQKKDTYAGRLFAKAGFDIGFRVVVVGDDVEPRDAVRLLHRTEQQRIEAVAEALAMARTKKAIKAERAACEKRTRKAAQSRKDRGLRRVALQGLGQQPVYPRIDRARQSDGPLYVEFTHAEWGKGVLLAYYFIENRGDKPHRVAAIAVFDQEDTLLPTEHVYLADVLHQRDKTLQALLAGTLEPEPVQLIGGRYPLDRTLEKGERVNGVIALAIPDGDQDDAYDIEPYAVRLYSGRGKPIAESGLEGWTTMRPVYKEEVERNRRARQVALSFRGLYGGFWTDDGADQGMLDGTTAGGVSLRFSKGMHHHFAFEGEVVVGRSRYAQFRGVPYQTMQGDVRRQASFGRLQAAGVIRFGTKYVTSTRLGLGVQGTNYNSRFTAGDVDMVGPGNSFDIDFVMSLGAGFDAHIGDHWTLGIGAAFAVGFKSDVRALESGFQLGYRWGP